MRLMLAALGILTVSTVALAQTPPTDQQPPAGGQQSEQTAPTAATQPPAPPAQQQPPAISQRPGATPQRRNAGQTQQQPVGPPKTLSDCRQMARTQNLQGDTMRYYMQGCRREVALGCRQQAQAQGLHGQQLREFVRSCSGMGQGARRQGGGSRRNAAPQPDAGDELDQD